MGKFNPLVIREQLLGRNGYEWVLADSFAGAQAVGGLGSSARANLGCAIKCLLVGFDEPAERLLKVALDWVEAAIATNERPKIYFPNGAEATRYATKALCNWLLFNRHDTQSFAQFVEFEDRYLADKRVAKDKTEVSFVLPTYVDAGAFERAIEIFHATPRLSPPTSLVVRGEGAMSYVVSRHRLGLQYSQAEFGTIAARFLKMHVDQWLDDGHWDCVAEWMKIVHWNDADPPIPAKQALLKCYDYLPGCQPPE